jgi:hypothetical protein
MVALVQPFVSLSLVIVLRGRVQQLRSHPSQSIMLNETRRRQMSMMRQLRVPKGLLLWAARAVQG